MPPSPLLCIYWQQKSLYSSLIPSQMRRIILCCSRFWAAGIRLSFPKTCFQHTVNGYFSKVLLFWHCFLRARCSILTLIGVLLLVLAAHHFWKYMTVHTYQQLPLKTDRERTLSTRRSFLYHSQCFAREVLSNLVAAIRWNTPVYISLAETVRENLADTHFYLEGPGQRISLVSFQTSRPRYFARSTFQHLLSRLLCEFDFSWNEVTFSPTCFSDAVYVREHAFID